MASRWIVTFVNTAIFVFSFETLATDLVIVNVGESENDSRIHFKNELVKMSLDITKDTYGDYKIVENKQRMNISRAFRELEKGETLTLTFAHTREEFEDKALPIRVPVRKGLDSYRLLMVRKGEEQIFAEIQDIEDLKQYVVGLSPNWSTYQIMQNHGFRIADATIYSSMFKMLESGRFDFIPRALNEVYAELESYQPTGKGLAIVPDIVLYIPSASYMFVSPAKPRLFQRLNSGLHALNVNGQLNALIDKYNKVHIEKAKIQGRRVISIEHSNVPTYIPQQPEIEKCNC